MTSHYLEGIAEQQAILQAWLPIKERVGVTEVRTEADYRRAQATIEVLLNEIVDDEAHPLSEVLDYLSDKVKAYEDQHISVPEAPPHEVLRFLMDQHQLKQEDLSDCAPQSRVSDILGGKRAMSKEIAKRFAHRFHVHADVFL